MKKKIFAIVVAVTLILTLFTACGGGASSGGASAGGIKTGLGHVVLIDKSVEASADADGYAQVDTIMAAVSVDSSGKIVSVTIDTAQTRVPFDASGKLKADLTEPQKTKVELGKDYGMIRASSIGKEWYEQIAELEKWMIGKTIDQVKAMKVKKVDDAHPSVPDEPDLVSKVTISVQDYIAAVEEAVKNAK
ncbi:MAG TPA: hypothetical protein GXX37_04965 [Clostridiaceae bacterium]|nr:hypothetical protein [Clostridiaceae bacterium]